MGICLKKQVKEVKEQVKQETVECVICMVSINDNINHLKGIKTLCNHMFHQVCLDSWISVGKITCPVCRQDLRDIEQARAFLKFLCNKKPNILYKAIELKIFNQFIDVLETDLDIKNYFIMSYRAGNFHITDYLGTKFPDKCIIIAYEELVKQDIPFGPLYEMSPYHSESIVYSIVIIRKMKNLLSNEDIIPVEYRMIDILLESVQNIVQLESL